MYEAWLYQPGRERKRVQVSSTPEGLALESPTGPQLWPYERLRFACGGAETRMLAVHAGPDTLYLADARLINELRAHLPASQQPVLALALRRKRGSWRKVLLGVGLSALLLAGLLIWAGFWLLTKGRDLAVSQIPVAWEQELGNQLYADMLTETPACTSPVLVAGIEALEARLESPLGGSPYNLEYQVIKSKEINAFALPGGRIALHAALVARAPGPEALAGVMAHEAQHVLQRHGLKGVINQLGLSLLIPLLFGDAGAMATTVAGVGGQLLSLDFSRSQESEADRLGLALLHQASVNPHGMAEFFGWMANEEKRAGSLPAFLSTHPLSSDRQQQLAVELGQLPAKNYQTLPLDWAALQAEAKKCLEQ